MCSSGEKHLDGNHLDGPKKAYIVRNKPPVQREHSSIFNAFTQVESNALYMYLIMMS